MLRFSLDINSNLCVKKFTVEHVYLNAFLRKVLNEKIFFFFAAAIDETGESWKFSLHPCAHSLYLVLLHEFREILTPLILKLVRDNQQIDSKDLNGILRKDAVYCSVGLCAFDLYDEVLISVIS